jgi:putative long chain acyl-CoA synthase
MTYDAEQKRGLLGVFRNLSQGAQNALEIARVGRLSPEVHHPYSVVRRERVYKLRRYERSHSVPAVDAPVVLVPPLMLTAEVYDIDPSLSSVALLTAAGVDTWVVDFGAPEDEEGGLERTLDDHVRSVSQAIDQVRALTGSDVHLAGYSQGGMFVYQAAAYRRSEGIKSLITFGSPVDIHRNLIVHDELAMRMIDSVSGLMRIVLRAMEGLPGAFSSIGFRVLTARKEARHLLDFVTNLHDREALMRGESSRRFLHGEGFVAWPGPALRSFFDQFVVENRMSQGGFVIDGRTLTLADVTCPILYFVGERDEFARPPSVHAIRDAAPLAQAYHVNLGTGHFGLVVGSLALKHAWPTLVEWVRWHEQKGLRPAGLHEHRQTRADLEQVRESNLEDVEYNARLVLDTARKAAGFVRKTARGFSHSLTDTFDNLRYQVPRLSQLEHIEPDSLISVGRTLREQAERIGNSTFFLWEGRAHSYADADRRVDAVVRGLIQCGVRRGSRVGVLMRSRPTYLSLVAALSRIGAVAVLLGTADGPVPLARAIELGGAEMLVSDPEHAARARGEFAGDVLVLGGGSGPRTLVDGVVDMERIDPTQVVLPAWYTPNPGRAHELALVMFGTGKNDQQRVAHISNRRWAVAAFGAAAASTLTSKDAVYCCMPLDHPAGILVAVGGALVGGARLALAGGFDPATFWTETRRYGVTVVYYAGDMCRALVDAPSSAADARNPVRLFAGSGMRKDVWRRLIERFNTSVLEFYATTEGDAALANVSGQKLGALGKPLPGTAEIALAAYDFDAQQLVRGPQGWLVRCYAEQPGVLLARVGPALPLAAFEGTAQRIVRDAFEQGDAWFVSGDVLRLDPEGDYWFVDRARDLVRTQRGPVATVQVEDVLYELPEIARAAVYGVALPGAEFELPIATLVVRDGHQLDPSLLARHLEQRLDGHARPRIVKLRGALPMSVGHRVLKQRLRAELLDGLDASFRYDEELKLYEALDAPALAALFEAKSTGATRPGRAPRGTSPGVAKPNSKRPKPRA